MFRYLKMNRIILFFILPLFLTIQGCNRSSSEAARIQFLVPLDINAGLGTIETHVFRVFDVQTFFEANTSNAGISPEDITQIQSSFGSFKGKFTDVDLNFIDGITVHILLDAVSGQRKELFYLDVVPLGSKEEIKMLASTSELKEVMNQEFIDLEFSIRLRQFSSNSFVGEFDLSFGVFVD